MNHLKYILQIEKYKANFLFKKSILFENYII